MGKILVGPINMFTLERPTWRALELRFQMLANPIMDWKNRIGDLDDRYRYIRYDWYTISSINPVFGATGWWELSNEKDRI